MASIRSMPIGLSSPRRGSVCSRPAGSTPPCAGNALWPSGHSLLEPVFRIGGPLHFVRCGVSCCSAVRDLRRLPPPSLGVSSLDLGRLLASGPFFFAISAAGGRSLGG